jgi:hypothetical protein
LLLALALPSPVAFCPFDGGVLELSGVFGGTVSFASNSATRAANAAICSACAWTCASSATMNASVSDDDSNEGSTGGVMDRLTHIQTHGATGIYRWSLSASVRTKLALPPGDVSNYHFT